MLLSVRVLKEELFNPCAFALYNTGRMARSPSRQKCSAFKVLLSLGYKIAFTIVLRQCKLKKQWNLVSVNLALMQN